MKHLIWAFAALALAVPARADAPADLNTARDLYVKDQYKDALPAAERAVQADGANAAARILLAKILIRLERPDAAVENLAAVTTADPKNVEAWTLTGEAHVERTLIEFRKWVKERGSDMLGTISSNVPTVRSAGPAAPAELIDLPESTSRSAMNPKEWERLEKPVTAAVAAYDRALEIEPSNVTALNGHGLASMLKGDWKDAADAFEKTSAITRFHVALYDVAASAHGNEQRSGDMIRTLEAVVRRDPTHPWVNLYLRDLYWHTRKGHWMGAYYNAAHILFSTIEDTSDARKYGPKDALKELAPITEKHPDFARGWWASGRAAMAVKDSGRALEYLRKAADLAPTDGTLQYEAAVALLQGKDDAGARPYLMQAAKDRPTHAPTWYALATLAERARDEDSAVMFYEKAVTYAPDWPEARFGLGALLLDRRQGAEALPHLQRYLELRPDARDAKDIRKAIDQVKEILARQG